MTVNLEGVTPTQAVFSYDTGDPAPCTVNVAEAATPLVLVHDIDPALFPGANQDLSRPSPSNWNQAVRQSGAHRLQGTGPEASTR